MSGGTTEDTESGEPVTGLVVVDPGHGGRDSGATAGGVRESDVVLVWSLALAEALHDRHIPFVLTRHEDEGVTPARRAQVANALEASCFISVHANGSANREAHGLQAIHARPSYAGQALARQMYDAVHGPEGLFVTPWSGVFPDESGWTGGRRLTVLRDTRMPAVLLEVGFLTNPAERGRLLDEGHRRDVTGRIARTLHAWLRERERWHGPAA